MQQILRGWGKGIGGWGSRPRTPNPNPCDLFYNHGSVTQFIGRKLSDIGCP